MEFFSLNVCYLCNLHCYLIRMKHLFIIFSVIVLFTSPAFGQFNEPDMQKIVQPKNLYEEGYRRGLGFSFNLNDFGFGAGIQYRVGLSPYREALINLKIAGLRDPSEQTHIDFYFGNRTIASKYRRVITFPTTIGFKQRLFSRTISDNFRVHTAMAFGPSFAVSLPYFDDRNENGYREADFFTYGYDVEPVNDIFQGWNDAQSEFGWNGELVIGIDFGDNFGRLQSFQFGYSFYYFQNGLQLMEPRQPIIENGSFVDNDGDGLADFEDAYGPVNFFGSAHITFVIGWMWD